MNKIPCVSQIRRPKPCLLMFATLIALDGFHLLLSSQLTANLTPKWSDGSTFHPLSQIYAKTSFGYVETVVNNALKRRRVVVADYEQTWHPLWPQLSYWQMFMQNSEYTVFWYLQLLCYLTQLQFTISQNNLVEFFGVFRDNCWIWMVWAFSIICICTTAFKVSISPLNHCFRQSRVRITLIKSLICLNSIFPIRKQCFISTRNSDFSLF